jgi:hypothetical protein
MIIMKMRVVMQKTDKWSEQISYYRFFNNEKVSEKALIQCATGHCALMCASLDEVLLIQDTTELNLEAHRQRITDTRGLGETGNGTDLGFFCHPTIVVNPRDGALMGVADLFLMARKRERDGEGNYRKKPKNYGQTIGIEEKESYRWIERGIIARKELGIVKQVTVVQDREGDIYESFCLLREAGVDFVIRSTYDRKIAGETGGVERIEEHLEGLSAEYEYEMEVEGDNKHRKKRNARMEVRYGNVRLVRPPRIGGGVKKYPKTEEIRVVQVQEKEETVPPGEKRIEWRLYTSHEVTSAEEAVKIIGYYKKRWIIEELFRTIKSEGVKYEETELETGAALRRLFVMAMMAAIQILQLRQAREGTTEQETRLVFSEEQIECMEDLLPRFEGKTAKQKNPHPKTNLAWASWMIARLGGWKGYTSQRPPGVITLHDGWSRFHDIFQGWLIAKNVYKR